MYAFVVLMYVFVVLRSLNQQRLETTGPQQLRPLLVTNRHE